MTEEVTGVDIVQTQMRIAAGITLPEMGLTQDKISVSGFAVQCRYVQPWFVPLLLVTPGPGLQAERACVRGPCSDDMHQFPCLLRACRITTEDPTRNFQPDSGIVSVYRSATGNGIRLDDGPVRLCTRYAKFLQHSFRLMNE